MALSLIQMKFDSVPEELQEPIRCADETEIREICTGLLTADSIEDLLKH